MDLMPTILTAGITSGCVTTMLNWYLKTKELGDQRRWEIKREACLEALDIIDARFADYGWESNGGLLNVDKQEIIKTEKVRSCFNRLVLACANSKVPQSFEKCLNLKIDNIDPKPLSMDAVVELRNDIRKELGFGKDLSTKVSWITSINWKRHKQKDSSQ